MNTQLDIEKLVKSGKISNELEYERAMIADRKLRLLSKENEHFKNLRYQLRNIIEVYEKTEWSDEEKINDQKISESDAAEKIAEAERVFFEKRKQYIRKTLKELDLTQENLALILGHKSKTHMSELVNGIKPFTLRDLIIIHRVLNIDMKLLVPVFLSEEDKMKIDEAFSVLNKPGLKLKAEDLTAV